MNRISINNSSDIALDYKQYIEDPFVKGLIRILVLYALREGEKKGYQVYQYICSIIKYRISLSTIYTVLKEMTLKGFVTKIRNAYKLTEKGIDALYLFIKRYNSIMPFSQSRQ